MSFAGRSPAGIAPGTIVSLSADTVATDAVAGSATTTISFQTDGTITYVQTQTVTDGPINVRWFSLAPGATFFVKCTPTVGTLTSGTTGSYLSLASSAQSFFVQQAGVGSKSCTATFAISSDGTDGGIVTSASITLTATRSS